MSMVLEAGQQVTPGGRAGKQVVAEEDNPRHAATKRVTYTLTQRLKGDKKKRKVAETPTLRPPSPERNYARDPLELDELIERARANGMYPDELEDMQPASDAMRRLWHGEPMPGREGHDHHHEHVEDRERVKVPEDKEVLKQVVRERQLRDPAMLEARKKWEDAAKLADRAKMAARIQARRDVINNKSRETRNANGHGGLTNVHLLEDEE